MTDFPYRLSDLIRVCVQATPYATPVRVQGVHIAPKWFAPREAMPFRDDDLHVHHMYEAQICLTGQAFFTLATTQRVGPGSVAMYPPRARHSQRTEANGAMFLFAGFEVNPPVHVTEPAHWPVWPSVLHDLEVMVEESRLHLRGWAERAGMRLSLILARVLTLAEAHPDPNPTPMSYDALAGEVDRYCEMYYAQPVRLEDVADYFQMSPRTLMRWYQRLTGRTIMDYLHEVRLRKAAWLLQHSRLPIAEVATSCGLQPNYFSRTFRTTYGISPGQYRKRQQL